MEGACKSAVQALITANQFIGKTETREKAMLFNPEDSAEGATEENAFNGCKGNEAFTERDALIVAPVKGPLGFFLNAGHGFNGIEESIFLLGISDKSVQ